jgi:eukaryotic-like serine/threonine-protein kinase
MRAMSGRLTPGTVFAGDFRVLRRLADGGMGTVYVAEQLSTGKRRALKVLKADLARDPKAFARFEQEARVASRIQSEHVVEVVAAGLDAATTTPWLAMELLEGADLGALVARRGPLPVADVREILAQLCHALAAAHSAGVVHRDLKPENVFVATAHQRNARFRVVVLDFGIAKIVEAARASSPATTALGTPRWMSPEQTDESAEITPAADVWALGLLAFYLLTGRIYWSQANYDESGHVLGLMREVLFEPLPAPSARAATYGLAHLVPRGFDAWFARCLERDARARLQDAGAAMEALDPVLALPSLPPASPGALMPVPYAPLTDPVAALTAAREVSGTATKRPVAFFVGISFLVVSASCLAAVLVWKATYTAPAPRRPELSGAYAIAASKNPAGGAYHGSVLMTGTGETYRVAWTISNGPGYEGIALLSDKTLAVGWGHPGRVGVAVYAIEGRRLVGRYAVSDGRAVGTEELEGGKGTGLGGTFTIRRSSNASTGQLTITPKGQVYELLWSTNRGRFSGVGLRSRDLLVAGFAPDAAVGVVVYEIPPPRGREGPWVPEKLIGTWSTFGERRIGLETLARR